ncbi:GmrSD restriction endonuclease domain-containing protein [Streptomyces sp. QHH-9511]|uniref:GmrSD restriction endonuclease domain-containing protein n=1 Tax=Streptomyces sp. QHH-9511 TaxID=2684468 RepID=UPI002FCCDA78
MYYDGQNDGQNVTDPASLRVDHVVSLDEAWQSGASGWTAARREKYVNDLGARSTLVAVTARSQKDKAGRDPADWLRWGLSADKDEMDALKLPAEGPREETVGVR